MADYWIIGDDGDEYGPVSESEIVNWIVDRRADASTLVRQGAQGPWKKAAEFPEFASALTAGAMTKTAGETATPARKPPSGLGVAGLVFGMLSIATSCCLPVTALPGIVCSALALRQRDRNMTPAVWGMALSLIGVLAYAGFKIAGVAFDGFLEGFNQPE